MKVVIVFVCLVMIYKLEGGVLYIVGKV